MLENWLQSPKVDKSALASWQLGASILQHIGEQFPDLRTARVALVGLGEGVDTIRQHFYQMAHPFRKFSIADIGNLRNPTEETLLPVLQELFEAGIIPIIISGESASLAAQFKAHQKVINKINLAFIDEKIPHHKERASLLSVLQKIKNPTLSNLALIGYQSHFCPPKSIAYYQKKNYDLIRLGKAKSNMEVLEPAIRDAHTLYFNLSALKQIEALGTWNNSPSGFSSEEACRICYYAGMSDKLDSIGLYGYCHEKDTEEQTAKLIAQMIWYVLEGINLRKKDFPVSTERMVEYIVSLKDYEYDMTFWKSTKSGRWWLEIHDNKTEANQLIPCAYEDYQLACKDELSERLLNIIERFS